MSKDPMHMLFTAAVSSSSDFAHSPNSLRTDSTISPLHSPNSTSDSVPKKMRRISIANDATSIDTVPMPTQATPAQAPVSQMYYEKPVMQAWHPDAYNMAPSAFHPQSLAVPMWHQMVPPGTMFVPEGMQRMPQAGQPQIYRAHPQEDRTRRASPVRSESSGSTYADNGRRSSVEPGDATYVMKRARNNEAVRKCRIKKKAVLVEKEKRLTNLERDMQRLEDENSGLRETVVSQAEELRMLKEQLDRLRYSVATRQ